MLHFLLNRSVVFLSSGENLHLEGTQAPLTALPLPCPAGKTAAFALPVLERLIYKPRQAPVTRVLMLVPTRELGIQVHSVTKQLAQFCNITVCLAVGECLAVTDCDMVAGGGAPPPEGDGCQGSLPTIKPTQKADEVLSKQVVGRGERA